MKILTTIVLVTLSLFGPFKSGESTSEEKNHINEKMACNCHCRIGYYKGSSVSDYPNPVVNIGVVESWGGPFGATNSRATTCKKRCTDAAHIPLYMMPKNEFCAKSERFLSGQNRVPMNRLAVYWKVGGRKWQSGDTRLEKCN